MGFYSKSKLLYKGTSAYEATGSLCVLFMNVWGTSTKTSALHVPDYARVRRNTTVILV